MHARAESWSLLPANESKLFKLLKGLSCKNQTAVLLKELVLARLPFSNLLYLLWRDKKQCFKKKNLWNHHTELVLCP